MALQERGGIGTFGNIATIVVFIIIITIGLWGAISAVRLAPTIFSSISDTFTGTPGIEVSIPSTEVRSGEVFTLSWQDSVHTNGIYTIAYTCTPNVDLQITSNGSSANPLPCDTTFAIPATETSLRLIPILKSGNRASVPISIVYIDNDGKQQTEGKTSLTVIKGSSVVAATTTPKTTSVATKPTTGAAPAPKPTGTPDLAIRLVAMGVIDSQTGMFVQKNVFGSYETVTYKFDVANRGSGRTGSWSFVADLPTNTSQLYQSPMQNPLGPGDHIEFTLNFSAPVSGSVVIHVDPTNAVSESNESNNTLYQSISVVY
ncbi:hypothetical protein HY413_02800 [Candidatus Kaiserbacteria bacterium]|nr:hypothetical protein [Candidatus Kaiserbacteria bacterium]